MADITTGLIFHAKLNEISGTAIVDSTGLHANGTLNGTLSTEDSPYPGRKAIQFNGTTNYIAFVDANDLDLAGENTCSYWGKVANGAFAATGGYIVAKLPVVGFGSGYAFLISNGAMSTVLFPVGMNYAPGTPDWNNGSWHHLAHVTRYSGGNATVDHYIDGILVSTSPSLAWTAVANAGPLVIGDGKEATVARFTGALSDVRIYNRALVADDIASLNVIPGNALQSSLGIGIGIGL